ncbi:MAG: hypothetical protein V7780_14240 [Colwellia sp.]
MKFHNLSFAFFWCFLLITLAFVPTHNLSLSLSVKDIFSWIGIIVLSFLTLKNLYKAKLVEYKELLSYLQKQVPFIDKELTESKTAVTLVMSGGACWFLILIFKDGLLPLPLFILGTTLMLWGISLFFEENGIYKFSESSLSNKWILAAVGSSLIYWASFKSAGQVNSIFNIEPSLFPFTLTAMVLYNIATLFFLLMIPVFLSTSVYMLFKFIYEVVTKKHKSELAIFPAVILFSAYASIFGLLMLTPEVQNKSVKNIALKTDFNSNHLCSAGWLKDQPVIFVGPNSNYVLGSSETNKKELVIQQCISL